MSITNELIISRVFSHRFVVVNSATKNYLHLGVRQRAALKSLTNKTSGILQIVNTDRDIIGVV